MPLASYLTRLIWLCVAPLLLFAVWLAYDKLRAVQLENEGEATVIARNFATALDQHLAARIGALNVLSVSPLIDNPARWNEFYRVAQGFRDNFGSHVLLAGVGEPMPTVFNTRVPFGTPLPPLPRPRGNVAAAQALASGKPAVGDIFMGQIARVNQVAIAVPVLREKQTNYLLLATFETRLFQERLDKVVVPEGWRLTLRDGQGATIASRGPARGDGEAVGYRVEVKSAVAPWSVAVEIPRGLYLGALRDAGLLVGGGVVLATLIGIGGGLLGRRRLAVAVARLMPEGQAQRGGADIAEFAAARASIDRDRRRIDGFAVAQDRAIEQERRRLAREVHDQLGQVFTAIKLIAQSIPRAAYPPGQEAALGQALELGIASARRITAELRPPLLDDLGLAAALEHYVRDIARAGPPAWAVEVRDAARLGEAQALGLFRIVQEAVTNVRRHAGASHVWIHGEADDGHYRLRIEDDGRGFDPAAVRPGALGLTGMRERARLLDGQCVVRPRAGGGAVVEVRLPLDRIEDDHEHPAA